MAAASDGSLQLGLRAGQVHQPQRHGLLRRHLAGQGADHGAGQSAAAPTTTSCSVPGPSATRCSSRYRTVRFSLEANDVPADRLRVDLRDRRCPRWSRTAPTTAPRVPHRGRAHPLPPDRRVLGVGRGRRRAHRARRPTAGSRPVTTPGACATTSACRRPTSSPAPGLDGRVVPVRLEPGADGAARRQPLRAVPERGPRVGPRVRPAHHHGPGRARPTARVEHIDDVEFDLTLRPGQPSPEGWPARGHDARRLVTAAPGRGACPTPASTSAPACTSGSTATTTANGGASSTSRASASTTARRAENARRLHQIRDTVVRVTDPVGGGVGVGQHAAHRLGRVPSPRPRCRVLLHVAPADLEAGSRGSARSARRATFASGIGAGSRGSAGVAR